MPVCVVCNSTEEEAVSLDVHDCGCYTCERHAFEHLARCMRDSRMMREFKEILQLDPLFASHVVVTLKIING